MTKDRPVCCAFLCRVHLYALIVKGSALIEIVVISEGNSSISRALKNEETVDGFSLLQRELALTEKLVKQTLSKEPANELRFYASLTN